ncbi:MAG: N-acetyltransferase family protein, partial [Cytophagales bacterium]|nr:N-acetyltransferase family protein [Cytophagales bacterium]
MEIHSIIRFGKKDDLPSIVEIYNQAIRSGSATGDLDEFKAEDRLSWFTQFDETNYPIYVVQVEGFVAGYGTLSPYRRGRRAMRTIAEISFFLDEKYQGIGLGSQLILHIIRDCNRIGKRTLLAILLDINDRSAGLLRKFGFEQWGHFPDV